MSTIRLQPSGREVEALPGDTVLAALERGGYALPNNCRAGACGECRTRVLGGEFDQGMVLSMALSEQDRADGWGLMCMATPTSDELEIEFGADDGPRLFPPRVDVPFVVTDRIPRTPRIVELRLRPVGEPLRYWPGQYVQLGDRRCGVPARCYSLASAPKPDGELSLLVTRVENGRASTWIHDELALGDTVTLDGPFGTFVGDPAVETPVVCLAAGSGLAPILALTDAALRRDFPHPVTLVFSARTAADELDIGLLAWWARTHPNFRWMVTYTGAPPTDAEWTGRIPEVLPSMFPDLRATSVFVAGPPEFVDDSEAAALDLGAEPDLLHTESYVPQDVGAVTGG